MWSEQAIEARRVFSRPELEEIKAEIDLKIGDILASDEGYVATRIAFVKLGCGFLLVYSDEEECWILAKIEIPPGGPLNPGRKRARRRNGYERVIDVALADWIGTVFAFVYNMGERVCREIAVFASDDKGRRIWNPVGAGLVATVTRYACRGRIDTSSKSCEDVVQLNRIQCSTTLRFVGPLWSLDVQGPGGLGGLWDPAWFGAPPEQVSG